MSKSRLSHILMAMACVLGLSSSALAEDMAGQASCVVTDIHDLSSADQKRMAGFEQARLQAFSQAMNGENADERALVADLFGGGVIPVDDLPLGAYQCRTIKLGGLLPLVAYGWFKCEIKLEADGVHVRKLTGSQNFEGMLLASGDQSGSLIYRGASYYGYEGPGRAYGDDPARDQVGCFNAVAGDDAHFVLELPFPMVESVHDVIEFVR